MSEDPGLAAQLLHLAFALWRGLTQASQLERAALETRAAQAALLEERSAQARHLGERRREQEEARRASRELVRTAAERLLARRTRVSGVPAPAFWAWRAVRAARMRQRSEAAASAELAARTLLKGSATGLLSAAFTSWRRVRTEARGLRDRRARAHAQVSLLLHRWERGRVLGTASALLAQWRNRTRAAAEERQRLEAARSGGEALHARKEMGRMQAAFAQERHRWEAARRAQRAKACASAELAVRRRERGDAAGFALIALAAWQRAAVLLAQSRGCEDRRAQAPAAMETMYGIINV